MLFLSVAALVGGQGNTRLGPLGEQPDWQRLDPYQHTITKDAFLQLLDVYAPDKAYRRLIEITNKEAFIRTGLPRDAGLYRLAFFVPGEKAIGKPARFWRGKRELGAASKKKPLAGLRIALDAGHLGGAYAKMEERWFKIGDGQPVKEGEMTLAVAKRLVPELEKRGARVFLVRSALRPVTRTRPKDYIPLARGQLERAGVVDPPLTYDPEGPRETRGKTVQWHSEKLFYRTSEIRARADRVNDRLKPDVAICIHFNAEAWGDPDDPDFVPRNHLHVLVNGTYSAGELRFDDVRLDMLLRLLQRVHGEELAVASTVATAMA
ncbi:MAG: hypothetical protein AAF514_02640, partial [Verrucomicrobiota bacterium]